jgi:hypothetical protein
MLQIPYDPKPRRLPESIMPLRLTSGLLLPSGLLLLLAGQVHAGTVLKTVNRDLANNREMLATTYAQQGSMRVETGNSSGTVVIFKDDVLYTIDPKEKTYIMIDRPTMQRVVEQLGPVLKQMQETLAKMPPEQRAKMEKMMGTSGAATGKPVVEQVRKTGRTDKIAGYACSYSEVLRDDVVSTEACVATPAALKGSQEMIDTSAKVAAFLKQLTDGLDVPFIRQMTDRQVDNFAELGGVPVRARRFADGKAVFESTLQSLAATALPATLFEVPAGYTRKELPMAR